MLKEELEKLLGKKAVYEYNIKYNTIKIYNSSMYECPQVQFNELKSLSELFGSEDIHTDMDYLVEKGCETCDYGSNYGYELSIVNPTKNIEEYKGFAKVR